MATKTTSVFGMTLMPSLDQGGLTKVTKQLAKLTQMKMGGLDAKSARNFQKMSETAAKRFRDIIGGARLQGLHVAADSLQSMMKDIDKDMTKLLKDRSRIEQRIAQVNDEGTKENFRQRRQAVQKEIDDLVKGAGARAEIELSATEDIIRRREAAAKRTKTEVIKGYADGFETSITDVLSKLKAGDVEGITRGLFAGLGKAGKGAGAKGAEMQAAGAGGVGKTLVKLGAVVGVLAAAAGAFALLVKMMVDADSQAKEFNKSLMANAGAADFAFSRTKGGLIDVTSQLGVARKAALSLAWEFRGDAKEIMGVIAQANEAGLTYKEMDREAKKAHLGMSGYAKVAETAMIYSKLLGVSMGDIATQTAEWMHDLGFGLREVDKAFSTVFQAAMQSGIQVKRFYSMVTQATAGMFLYNVRVSEAAGMIAELAKALGEAGASQFVQGLSKGFAAQSYTERFKRVIIAGKGDMREIMGNAAASAAQAFNDKLQQTDFKQSLEGAFETAEVKGINIDLLGKGNQGELKKLAKMTDIQVRQVSTIMRRTDAKGAEQLIELHNLAKGMVGSASDQAKALEDLDMGGKLATLLSGGLGGKTLSEMSALELAAFESYAGISGEQLKELRRVDMHMRGTYEEIRRLAKKKPEELSDEEKKFLKEQGITMSEDGKTILRNGVELGSINKFLATQGDTFAKAVDLGMSEDRAIAKGIAMNTTSMADSLQTGIQIILEQIYDVMTQLLAWSAGMSKNERKNQQEAIGKIDAQTVVLRKGLEKNAQELSEAREVALTAAGEEKVAAADRVRVLERKRTMLEAGVEQQQQVRKALHRRQGEWGPQIADTAEQMVKQAQGEAGGASLDIVGRKFGPEVARSIQEAAEAARDAAKEASVAQQATSKTGVISQGLAAQAGEEAYQKTLTKLTQEQIAQSGDVAAGMADEEAQERISLAAAEVQAASIEGQTTIQGKAQELEFRKLKQKMPKLTEEGYIAALKKKEQEDIVKILEASGKFDKENLEKVKVRLAAGGRLNDAYSVTLRQAGRGGLAGVYGTSFGADRYGPSGNKIEKKNEDFIYRGNASGGTITPFNKADDLLGAKAGGAIDRAFGGRGGGGVPVTINVYGSQAETMKAIRKGINLARGRGPTGGKRG